MRAIVIEQQMPFSSSSSTGVEEASEYETVKLKKQSAVAFVLFVYALEAAISILLYHMSLNWSSLNA